jgi:hypothetical protein
LGYILADFFTNSWGHTAISLRFHFHSKAFQNVPFFYF